jgi:CBS domain containing-hemolysin-like protein
MLQRIFEFGNIKARDVMVPISAVTAINIGASPDELLNTFVERGHARLPVYHEATENIVGIIYARDLLYILRDKELFVVEDLVRDAYYVPGNMPVDNLLKKFQEDKIQIAIVIGENKKAQGLVTLEDLLEEIVGEIEEHRAAIGGRKKKQA